jgi:hypothetical protein
MATHWVVQATDIRVPLSGKGVTVTSQPDRGNDARAARAKPGLDTP